MLTIVIAAALFLGAVSVAFNVICFRRVIRGTARRRRRPERYKVIRTDWAHVLGDTWLTEK